MRGAMVGLNRFLGRRRWLVLGLWVVVLSVAVPLAGQGALWAALQAVSKDDLSHAERSGFPVVALILLLVFGSLAAATLPLTLGAASVLVAGALIYLLSRTMEMSVFVTNMA